MVGPRDSNVLTKTYGGPCTFKALPGSSKGIPNIASSNLKRRTENEVGSRSYYTSKERHHAAATLWRHCHTVAMPMASTTQWLGIAKTSLVVKIVEVRRLL